MIHEAIRIFDFLKALTETKVDLTNHERFEKDYSPYMINRFLSMEPSTLYFAHFANNISDKKIHYMFLLGSLEKKKVYLKYIKKNKEKDTKIIQQCFDVSIERSIEYLDIISKKDLKLIQKKYGGKTK
jgi:hypothetical protein